MSRPLATAVEPPSGAPTPSVREPLRGAPLRPRRSLAPALVAANRGLWMVILAVWAVLLLAGSYVGRLHLRGAGVASLAATSLLGLAYVLSGAGMRRWHRALGIAANVALGVEMAVYLARRADAGALWLAAGAAAALVVLGVPVALLLAGPVDDV